MKFAPLLLASGYNRKLIPLRFWGMACCGLVLMFALASGYTFNDWMFWEVSYARPMVSLIVLAYLISAVIAARLKFLSRMEGFGAITVAITLGFLMVIVILAFGRLYYSRSFLLTTWFFSIAWVSFSYFLGTTATKLTLAVIPGGVSHELVSLEGIDWKVLRDPAAANHSGGVVVDLHQKLAEHWVRFLSECSLRKLPVFHAAVVYEAVTGRISLSHLSEGFVEDFKLPPLYAGIKRLVDIVVTLLAAPFLLPIGLFLALVIRLDSAGPALFWQERVGQNGTPFRMYKFRSMYVGADAQHASFASEKDCRITRVGKLLRKFRLDEIPQFWNILRGDMSLIGPRPEQVPFALQFSKEIPFYSYRHLVKPGLTGWAQVTQGYAAGVDENRRKLERDLYYIKYFSFWIDFWILCKTLRAVLTGFGAR